MLEKKKKRENLLMNIFPIYIGHGIFPSMFSFSFNFFFTFLLFFFFFSISHFFFFLGS